MTKEPPINRGKSMLHSSHSMSKGPETETSLASSRKKWASMAVVQGVVGNEAEEAGRGRPCWMEAMRRV